MKNFIQKSIFLTLISSAFIACEPTLDVQKIGPGTADFSKYISIGDGTPGGYANASLNRDAQLAAFPNLLAQQFKLVGGADDFIMPLVAEGKSFGFENGKPFSKYDLHYVTFCDGKKELYPEQLYIISAIDIFTFTVSPVPTPTTPAPYYNNLAAQGTKAIYVNKKPGWFHAPSTTSTAATYWQKISSTKSATGAGAATMLSDAIAQKPTFVSIHIGTVDVMRYGKSGGNQDKGDDDMITPVSEFRDSIYSILSALTENGTNKVKGVINNIIGVESFPYVTYIKYDGLILTEAQAAELNTYHGGQFTFKAGRNPYVIVDPTAPNKKRQILPTEHIIVEIPQDSLRCHSLGGKLPIRQRWVLDEAELNTITTTINTYNTILKSAAMAYDFAYVDANTNIKRVVNGTQYAGIKLTNEFVNGNYFSLDGLNVSPIGQLSLANNMIIEINAKYGSTIPLIDATKIKGIVFH